MEKMLKRLSSTPPPKYNRLSRMWEYTEEDGTIRFSNVPPGAMQGMGGGAEETEEPEAPVADDESLKAILPSSPIEREDEDRPAMEFNDEEEFDRGLKSLASQHEMSEDEMDEALVAEGSMDRINLDEYLKRGMSGMDIKKMIIPKKWELPERIKRIKGRRKKEDEDAE